MMNDAIATRLESIVRTCRTCGGTGTTEGPPGKYGTPSVLQCECRLKANILARIERSWPGTLAVKPYGEKSPLANYTGRNLYLTSDEHTLRRHLLQVLAAKWKDPFWSWSVATDAGLIAAQFTSLKAESVEIFDLEIAETHVEAASMEDVTMPPDLLVLRIGVKQFRNKALPEAVAEAITTRSHKNLPTWIVDSPWDRLIHGHIAYSANVENLISGWDHVDISTASTPAEQPASEEYGCEWSSVNSIGSGMKRAPSGRNRGSLAHG